jgi:hypothetical protein
MISTSSSISHTQSAPRSTACRAPSLKPPEPPVLISISRFTSIPAGNLAAASAITAWVSSVLALSTTTTFQGGVVIRSMLASRPRSIPERL